MNAVFSQAGQWRSASSTFSSTTALDSESADGPRVLARTEAPSGPTARSVRNRPSSPFVKPEPAVFRATTELTGQLKPQFEQARS